MERIYRTYAAIFGLRSTATERIWLALESRGGSRRNRLAVQRASVDDVQHLRKETYHLPLKKLLSCSRQQRKVIQNSLASV